MRATKITECSLDSGKNVDRKVLLGVCSEMFSKVSSRERVSVRTLHSILGLAIAQKRIWILEGIRGPFAYVLYGWADDTTLRKLAENLSLHASDWTSGGVFFIFDIVVDRTMNPQGPSLIHFWKHIKDSQQHIVFKTRRRGELVSVHGNATEPKRLTSQDPVHVDLHSLTLGTLAGLVSASDFHASYPVAAVRNLALLVSEHRLLMKVYCDHFGEIVAAVLYTQSSDCRLITIVELIAPYGHTFCVARSLRRAFSAGATWNYTRRGQNG